MVELILSLILALTGIPRTTDPALTAEAQRRVEMIQTNFSHDGLTTWEVLAWNEGYADPATEAVEQWMGSPDHRAILTDPSLTRIGCAADQDGTRWYFVCALGRGPDPATEPPAPSGHTSPPPGEQPAPMLPDTALPAGTASSP